MSVMSLSSLTPVLSQMLPMELTGRVRVLSGSAVEVEGMLAPLGAQVEIHCRRPVGHVVAGQVVHCSHDRMLVYPFHQPDAVEVGDRVVLKRLNAVAPVGEALFGRTVDGLGIAIDDGPALTNLTAQPLRGAQVQATERTAIHEPLMTGVRVIDAMLTVGRGQRLGIFAPPGVGKSTLLDMMCQATDADVVVRAIVGERGHEVATYLRETTAHAQTGAAPRITVASTSDEPAMMRVRSAYLATAIAEWLRDQGKHVLLIMDSVTRFCQALREIGLAAGQIPVAHGYPPSVFNELPLLLERPGCTQSGSVTALYAVLAEDEDADDPVSEACRGILDGHVLLSRQLAERGQYPAVDLLKSISRAAHRITSAEHRASRASVVRLVSDYASVVELLEIGGYQSGSHAAYDVAIEMKPHLDKLFQQTPADAPQPVGIAQVEQCLQAIHNHATQLRQERGG